MDDVLVTVPHHSGEVPLEILATMLGPMRFDDHARRNLLERIRREGDPSSDRLFDLPGSRIVSATVSRFVADLNRARDDRGTNGVVKRTDFAGRPLYPSPELPSAVDVADRLVRFFDPFHAQLQREIRRRRPLLVVDAHTMTAAGPVLGPDAGRPRPAASLITGGGTRGEPIDRPVSFPPELTRDLARQLQLALESRLPLGSSGLPAGVRINDPFTHGFIQERYGADPDGPRVPTVAIEIHRGLFEDAEANPNEGRIGLIRAAIVAALTAVRPQLERLARS